MSRVKKLLILIIALISFGIICSGTSNAKDWGYNPNDITVDAVNVKDTVRFSKDWAMHTYGRWFCVYMGTAFGDINFPYTAISKISIVGDASTDHTGKTIHAKENRKLADILCSSNGKGGFWDDYSEPHVKDPAQYKVWKYISTWINKVGKFHDELYDGFTNSSKVDIQDDISSTKYAEDYSKKQLEDKTDKEKIQVSSYVKGDKTYLKIGEFQFNFRKKLTEFELQDTEQGKSYKATTFLKYEGSNLKEITIDQIKSGDKFYAVIPIDTGLARINKIKVKGKYDVKAVDMVFWRYKLNTDKVGYQNTLQFNPRTGEEEEELSIPETIDLLLNISGRVWEDKGVKVKSEETYNDIFDKDTEAFPKYLDADGKEVNAKVIVRLINRDTGEVVKNIKGEECIKELGNDGEYLFANLSVANVKKYVVEFEYDGLRYTSVKPLVGNDMKINSKSVELEAQRKALNSGFKEITNAGDTNKRDQGYSRDAQGNPTGTITYKNNTEYYESKYVSTTFDNKTYSGTNLTANTDAKYNIGEQYEKGNYEVNSDGTKEIKYVNLGVKKREMPNIGLSNDISNAYVIVNGYNHDYAYGQKDSEISENLKNNPEFNLGVKFKNTLTQQYGRAVYPSDVKYSGTAGTEDSNKLRVYVKYATTVRNGSRGLYMAANELVTYYDKNFELVEQQPEDVVYKCTPYYIDANGNEVPITFNKTSKYSQAANGDSLFNTMYTTSLSDLKIKQQESVKVYFTFKVSDEAVLGLLNQSETLECVSEVFSYSTYYGEDEEACKTGDVYAAIDQFSAPGNAKTELDGNREVLKTTFEADTDSAPSLLLEAKGARDIDGTVFEDNTGDDTVKSGAERKGNGLYETNSENTVKDVKVQLLKLGTDVPVKIFPPKKEQENNEAPAVTTADEGIDAVTMTNDKGYYRFRGVEPDKYVIKYTYSNGTSKLVDTSGKEIKDITVQDYKSTIITSDNIKNAFENNNSNLNWYKVEADKRYSDARDVYEQREAIDNDMLTVNTNTNPKITSLDANTPNFEIGLEYDTIQTAAMTGEDRFCVLIQNVDFGIAQRPKQNATLDKKIKFLKLSFDNGQIYTSGAVDLKNRTLPPHVFASDDKHVYLTIDPELLEGSQVEIKYDLIFTNSSELDYRNKEYYYYGTSKENPVMHEGTTLFDYIDSELVLKVGENEKWKVIEELSQGKDSELLQLIRSTSEEDRQKLRELLKNSFSTIVASDKLDFGKGIEPGKSTSAEIVVEKLLTQTDKELSFENNGEVVEVKKSGGSNVTTQLGNYAAELVKPEEELKTYRLSSNFESDQADAEITTILPPTGSTNQYLTYAIVGILSLTVLGVGIFGIKRFLKK